MRWSLFSGLVVLFTASLMAGCATLQPESSTIETNLERLLKAYSDRNAKTYRSTLKAELNVAQKLSSAQRAARLSKIERLTSKQDYTGLEPLFAGYLKIIAKDAGEIDPEAWQRLLNQPPYESILKGKNLALEGSPLRFPRSAENCAHFWQRWARSGPGGPGGGLPPGGEHGLITCLGEVEYPETALISGMDLPAAQACSEYAVILEPPGNIPNGFTVSAVPGLPWGGALMLSTDGIKIALYTQTLFEVPRAARSQNFIIRVSSAGTDHDFNVTLPVELGIHVNCNVDISYWQFSPNNVVDIPIYGSGPQGTLTWGWNPTDGHTLPSGLSLNNELDTSGQPTGNARLHGTVQLGACSAKGELTLAHGSNVTQRNAGIRIPVHFAPGAIDALATVQEITRGQQFTHQLPTAQGGDCDPANYSWSLSAGSTLPIGLRLNRAGNNNWQVNGMVANNAPVEQRRVTMRVESGQGELGRNAEMNFNLSIPFRVWSQNMRLYPPDYIPTAVLGVLCLWPPACVIPVAIEKAWDDGVKNTSEDNLQRAGFVIEHLNNQQNDNVYDIVALQEMWESPFTDGMRDYIVNNTSALGYNAFDGPPVDAFEISSGLVTLVRNPFSAPSSRHLTGVYNDGTGFDGYAQKGILVNKVNFSSDPNDYIYVVNTHLQADNEPGVRANQLSQLKDFIDHHTTRSHPVVMMGDFNVVAPDSEYAAMLNRLGNPKDIFESLGAQPYTSDSVRNAYAHFWNEPERTRIDYILLRQGNNYELVVDDKALEDREYTSYLCRDGRSIPASGWLIGSSAPIRCYMSDHFGLSANLRFNKK